MRFLLVTLLFAACSTSVPSDTSSASITSTPGTDSADRSCQVILRSFARHGGTGIVDVATSLATAGATAGMLYRDPSSSTFLTATGVPIDGGGSAYQRFQITITDALVDTLAVYALGTDGSRLFDHNRVSGDFDNYQLVAPTFAIADDAAACPAQAPQATVDFPLTGAMTQHGAIVAGGQVTITYAIDRLTSCRATEGAAQVWDIEADVKLEPQGTLLTHSVTSVETPGGGNPTRVAAPYTFDVPPGTQHIEIWFRNYDATDSCEAYDSSYGANYQLSVDTLPAPIGWAGNWGNGFSASCNHIDGLAEPVVIDESIREDGCMFVDAEVWVPGLTDRDDAPAQDLWAQVAYSYDTGATQYDWLTPQGRVGNNQRYRWTLPYDFRLTARTFTEAHFTFRFSNDGVTFFTIGQGAGPDGGATRTITETTN